MSAEYQSYMYAIFASVFFSSASLGFAHFSKKISSVWMNFFKICVCVLLLSLLLPFTGPIPENLSLPPVLALMLSGLLGLGIGDIFLLTAYARIGAGRTLILFGFQPLFLGVASWYLFDQDFSYYRWLSIGFFILCLFLFSLEKYKEHGHWEIYGLAAALLGVMFDNTGILLTRWSFETVPELSLVQANFIRCLGAFVFFVVCNPFLKSRLKTAFMDLTRKEKYSVIAASAGGTFLSLLFYLHAIRIGHLASLAALGVFGPLFSNLLECVIYKKKPSRYLVLGVASFLVGFAILLKF